MWNYSRVNLNMFSKSFHNKKSGRTFLFIVKAYKHKESDNVRPNTVLSTVCLVDIKDNMDDPLAHFTWLVKIMTLEEKDIVLMATINMSPPCICAWHFHSH